MANDLVVGNTRFTKRESHLATYCSGIHKTQIDFILYHKSFRTAVYNVKVIPSEECAQQLNLLVCDFKVSLPKAKKRNFTQRIRTWKLRDPAIAKEYNAAFKKRVNAVAAVVSDCNVEDVRCKLKATQPLRRAVSLRNTNGNGKPGGGMTRLMRPSKPSVHVSDPTRCRSGLAG